MPVTVSVNYRGSFPPLTLVKGVLCVLTAFSLGLNKTLFRHFLALVRRQHSLVPGSNTSLLASLGPSEITAEGCFPVCLKLSCFWMRDTVPTQSNTAAMGGLRYKIDTHLCVQMSSGSGHGVSLCFHCAPSLTQALCTSPFLVLGVLIVG